jgi:hypothetical protein
MYAPAMRLGSRAAGMASLDMQAGLAGEEVDCAVLFAGSGQFTIVRP